MALATITLIGLYNYDHALFDELNVPEGIDRDTLVDNILLKAGEMESLYSSIPFIKNAIGIWSRKWYDTFEHWVDTLSLEYNPIENYDRMEDWTDTNTGSQTTTGSGSEKTVKTGSIKDEGSGTDTTENSVSAYDATGYTARDKTEFKPASARTTTFNQATDTHSLDNLQNKRVDDLSATHSGRVHGNIGVTSSQQLAESELLLRMKWNLYEHIADLFLSEFVIPVY